MNKKRISISQSDRIWSIWLNHLNQDTAKHRFFSDINLVKSLIDHYRKSLPEDDYRFIIFPGIYFGNGHFCVSHVPQGHTLLGHQEILQKVDFSMARILCSEDDLYFQKHFTSVIWGFQILMVDSPNRQSRELAPNFFLKGWSGTNKAKHGRYEIPEFVFDEMTHIFRDELSIV